MTRKLERQRLEMLRSYIPSPEGLTILDSFIAELDGIRPRGRAPKVTTERKQAMADKAIDWYRLNGGKREHIAADCGAADNEDERAALKRFLANDEDCQRRLNEIDGR